MDTSTNSKAEGAFYVWTAQEVEEVLGTERSAAFNEVYGELHMPLVPGHSTLIASNLLLLLTLISESAAEPFASA